MADSATVRSSSSQSSLSSSLTSPDEETIPKSSEEMIEEIAIDLRNNLNFSVDREEAKFTDSIETMLSKLDEYFSLVDMIRSDTTLCLTNTIPDIEAKCSELDVIFDKIDRLEAFVGVVRQNVAVTEDLVNKAEADMGTVGGLMKKLTSFVSMKRTSPITASSRKSSDFTPPTIFSTSDFFEHPPIQEDSAKKMAAPTASSKPLSQGK